MRMQVPSLALLSKLRIWPFCELWYRLKMWLRFHIVVAVVQASSYSSDAACTLPGDVRPQVTLQPGPTCR